MARTAAPVELSTGCAERPRGRAPPGRAPAHDDPGPRPGLPADLGRDAVLPGDRRWAAALQAACARTGAVLRGMRLSTSGGVRPLRP